MRRHRGGGVRAAGTKSHTEIHRRGGAPDRSLAYDDHHVAVAARDVAATTVAVAMQENVDQPPLANGCAGGLIRNAGSTGRIKRKTSGYRRRFEAQLAAAGRASSRWPMLRRAGDGVLGGCICAGVGPNPRTVRAGDADTIYDAASNSALKTVAAPALAVTRHAHCRISALFVRPTETVGRTSGCSGPHTARCGFPNR